MAALLGFAWMSPAATEQQMRRVDDATLKNAARAEMSGSPKRDSSEMRYSPLNLINAM